MFFNHAVAVQAKWWKDEGREATKERARKI